MILSFARRNIQILAVFSETCSILMSSEICSISFLWESAWKSLAGLLFIWRFFKDKLFKSDAGQIKIFNIELWEIPKVWGKIVAKSTKNYKAAFPQCKSIKSKLLDRRKKKKLVETSIYQTNLDLKIQLLKIGQNRGKDVRRYYQ